jgi:predicted dehydrogenase
MKTVVQPVKGGPVEVIEVPRPLPAPTEVLVATIASVISPGTERAVTKLAQSSLLAKARARPDLVRQVAGKAKADGLAAAVQAVRSKLDDDVALGYSAAGRVIAVGSAVSGIGVGQLVATGGQGQASHAEFQAVPGLLCAVVPEAVAAEDAAFTTIAAIGLHGLRLAGTGPGAKVVVIGLGLIGQLTARLAAAAGCDVAGIDPSPRAREVATAAGVLALDEAGSATTARVLDWSRGRGADAVLICAATTSSEPARRATDLCRDRARLVIVGDVGLDLERTPLYLKEISLRFARSYGPGRYEPSYEAWGVDYPPGQVRWTEGRNFEAVLDLLAAGRLAVADLVTHTFEIAEAAAAYRLIESRAEPYLAIRLRYPSRDTSTTLISNGSPPPVPPPPGQPGVGWIGLGAFSASTLLPAFQAAGFARLACVASAGGISAARAVQRHGFGQALGSPAEVIEHPATGVVVIATPHDTHAELTAAALRAGRSVWCEKPLALTLAELDEVEQAWRASGRCLAAGFNRRWSPAVAAARQALAATTGPKLLVYRVAAGRIPEGHWYRDRRQGGRVIGEACHFVDTAQALIGAAIEQATALPGHGLPGEDALVSLRFADGSLAAIGYGSVTPAAGKERIEITAGGRQVVIDDFRRAQADGSVIWKGRQDKGHRAAVAAFRAAVTQGDAVALPTETMLATMRATIQAAGGDADD